MALAGEADAVAVNPWTGQSWSRCPSTAAHQSGAAVPEAEVVALLSGPADPKLADLMPIAGLTGMRIEEVYRLRLLTPPAVGST